MDPFSQAILAAAGAGSKKVEYIGANTTRLTTASTTVTVATPTGAKDGDLIVAVIIDGELIPGSNDWSTESGWSGVFDTNGLAIQYRNKVGSSSENYTFTSVESRPHCVTLLCFRNAQFGACSEYTVPTDANSITVKGFNGAPAGTALVLLGRFEQDSTTINTDGTWTVVHRDTDTQNQSSAVFIKENQSGLISDTTLSYTGTSYNLEGMMLAITPLNAPARNLELVGYSQSSNNGSIASFDVTVPTGTAPGDILFLFQRKQGYQSSQSNTLPTGFTSIDQKTAANHARMAAYMVVPAEGISVVNCAGLNGATGATNNVIMVTFRKALAITPSIDLLSSSGITTADPVAITLSGGQAFNDYVAFGWYTKGNSDSFISDSFSITADQTITEGHSKLRFAILNNGTPGVTIDMADGGSANQLVGFYLRSPN